MEKNGSSKTASALRWGILRRALIPSTTTTTTTIDSQEEEASISRKPNNNNNNNNVGFGLIPFRLVSSDRSKQQELFTNEAEEEEKEKEKEKACCVCYTLPDHNSTKLFLYQRVDNCANLNDFRICNTYDIDNTGIVCSWPSEEVLAYYCLSQLDLFRSKRVIELGSGYGLAGLLIAAVTKALEVVISDGNPQVVDYIQRNVKANLTVFGGTKVKSMMLHWNHDELSDMSNSFDIIVASDCTFFKEFHKGLVQTIKCLLRKEGTSEAIFVGPKRGNSLDEFLMEVKQSGLQFTVDEIYNSEVWRRHQNFSNNDASWPNYEKDHCYPLLVRITL
uniref:calmodulin-lysine N-methyltransferase n=1 Tax=Erigeron canadensis TaxID=72917 RepID=UPI001CB9877B|nr:calmodulin-lysine N-methyltransferase [Erigeron canadensis]